MDFYPHFAWFKCRLFVRDLSVDFSGQPIRSSSPRSLKMGLRGCPKTSVGYFHRTLRQMLKDRRSHHPQLSYFSTVLDETRYRKSEHNTVARLSTSWKFRIVKSLFCFRILMEHLRVFYKVSSIDHWLLDGRPPDRFPVVSLGFFSVATDRTMCPGVDLASKNEYQGFLLW
jgi:hypothetical protein